jgi:hypothetical protein
MDHKWKQLILVVNFLFGLRVNEITNKKLILESHRPFICSVFLMVQYLNVRQCNLGNIIIHTVLIWPS